MNCADAYDSILEADPAILRGEGAGELAQHLRECAACRESAHRVLEGLATLDRALEGEASRRPARREARTGWSVARRLSPLGLLAAAAAVVVLLWHPGAPSRTVVPAPTGAPVAFDVDVSASSRPVAVFRTADPNITVVWFF